MKYSINERKIYSTQVIKALQLTYQQNTTFAYHIDNIQAKQRIHILLFKHKLM